MEAPPCTRSRRPWMETAAYRRAERHCFRALRLSGTNADFPASWRHVCRALELDPDHAGASILAGELWLYEFDEIGYADHSARSAAETALPYFDRALEVEPLHADAWAGKAHALCRLERYPEALAAAEAGFSSLPHRVDYISSPEVYPYVDRELSAAKVKALFALGHREEAERAVQQALARYPGHEYLEGLTADLGE